jgi:hypothetical protein
MGEMGAIVFSLSNARRFFEYFTNSCINLYRGGRQRGGFCFKKVITPINSNICHLSKFNLKCSTSIPGIKNANVFPVPVLAFANISLPDKIKGIDSAWTGVIFLHNQ